MDGTAALLPPLWKLVFEQLPVDMLPRIARTCKEFNSLLDETVWHKSFANSFGEPARELSIPWKKHALGTVVIYTHYLGKGIQNDIAFWFTILGNKFCVYYGEAPAISLEEVKEIPLTALLQGFFDLMKVTRVFVWAALSQHSKLLESMLKLASVSERSKLANYMVGRMYPLGSDTWVLETKENGSCSIMRWHTDVVSSFPQLTSL